MGNKEFTWSSLKISHSFPRWRWGSIGKVKLSPNKLSDWPKILSTEFKKLFNGIFYWLTAWCLYIPITWQWLRLWACFFLLFDIASTQEVPFAIPLFVQCILRGVTSALLCVPYIFAHHEKCWGKWWLPFVTEIIHNFYSSYLDCRSSF